MRRIRAQSQQSKPQCDRMWRCCTCSWLHYCIFRCIMSSIMEMQTVEAFWIYIIYMKLRDIDQVDLNHSTYSMRDDFDVLGLLFTSCIRWHMCFCSFYFSLLCRRRRSFAVTLVQLWIPYYKQLARGGRVIRNAIIPEDASVSLACVCDAHLNRNVPSGLCLMAWAVT